MGIDVIRLPTCKICDKKVESLRTEYCPMRMEKVFTVSCHGAEESCAISDIDMHEITLGSMQVGFAFYTKRLQ